METLWITQVFIFLLKGTEVSATLCKYLSQPGDDQMVTGKCIGETLSTLTLPYNQSHRVRHLRMSYNNFRLITQNAFKFLPNLRAIELDHNMITSIDKKTFWILDKLEYLDLSFNKFDYSILHEDFFKYQTRSLKCLKVTTSFQQIKYPLSALRKLFNLKELHINGIEMVMFPKDIAHLPSLSTLNLQIPYMTGGDRNLTLAYMKYLKTSNLKDLSLQSNGLEFIEQGSFSDFRTLRILNLASNRNLPFDHVINVLGNIGTTPLESLILDGVSLHGLTELDDRHFCNDIGKKVVRLSLKHTGIIGASYQMFDCFEKLEVLSFGFNKIITWTRGHPPVRDTEVLQFLPHNLKVVDMSHLYEISSMNFYDTYSTWKQVYTSEDYFQKALGKILKFTQKTELTMRNARPLWPFTNKTCIPVYLPPALKAINMDYFQLNIEVKRIRFNADNNLQAFTAVGFDYSRIKKIHIPFYGLTKLIFLDISRSTLYLSNDLFECNGTIFPELKIINISRSNLGGQTERLPYLFRTMPNVEVIDMSFSDIALLQRDTFTSVNMVKTINLAGNRLSSTFIINVLHLTHLKLLNLSYNFFNDISESMLKQIDQISTGNFSRLQIDIQGNHIICTCQTIHFLKWIHATRVNIFKKNDLMCDQQKKPTKIISFPLEPLHQVCDNPRGKNPMAKTLSAAISSAFVVIICAALFHRKRWFFQWNYYRLRHYFRQRASDQFDRVCLPQKEYDAFVIYSENSEDDTNVVREVMPDKLEHDGQFQLFFNGRDDMAGTTIADEIIRAIDESNKAILLVTSDFITDDWCIFALHMVIEKGNISDDLCILLQNDVDILKMPKVLLKLIGPNSGVQVVEFDQCVWNEDNTEKQRLFYSKLMDFLKGINNSPCNC